jgi:nucleotidyltransferase/DNA polymerase involved in DNA repair
LGVVNAIRADILRETRCTASAGVAHSPLLARVATQRSKPNGW